MALKSLKMDHFHPNFAQKEQISSPFRHYNAVTDLVTFFQRFSHFFADLFDTLNFLKIPQNPHRRISGALNLARFLARICHHLAHTFSLF